MFISSGIEELCKKIKEFPQDFYVTKGNLFDVGETLAIFRINSDAHWGESHIPLNSFERRYLKKTIKDLHANKIKTFYADKDKKIKDQNGQLSVVGE